MVEQTDRLTRMLNLLLDLSRVEAGRLELNLEPVDLTLLIRRVTVSVQQLSNRHQIDSQGPSRTDGHVGRGATRPGRAEPADERGQVLA